MFGIINTRNGKVYKNNFRTLATARQFVINVAWVSTNYTIADFMIVRAV